MMISKTPIKSMPCSSSSSIGEAGGSQPSRVVVVGGGRIGRAFLQLIGTSVKDRNAKQARLRHFGMIKNIIELHAVLTVDHCQVATRAVLIGRGQPVTLNESSEASYPIIVATHASSLNAVLEQTPKKRWKDLIFVQNGMLQPWFVEHGLQENTQGILYMSAVARDTTQVDLGVDIVNGGRPSQFLGRWAPLVAEIMCDAGLQCSVVRHEIYLESLVEKLLWSSIFWLLSASLGSISVGKIAKNYTQHVHELVTELMPLAQSYIESIKIKEPFVKRLCNNGCTGEDDQIEHSQRIKFMHSHSADSVTDVKHMVDRLCAYSVAIDSAVPSMQMAASEFDWRNGWFLKQKITPQHMMWLKRAGFCEDL